MVKLGAIGDEGTWFELIEGFNSGQMTPGMVWFKTK